MRKFVFLLLVLYYATVSAQETLTLEECYELAEEQYPLSGKFPLLVKKTAGELDIIQKDYLPKIDLNLKASYQSDVTEIPIEIPGKNLESIAKDQYRATLDVEQLIYNGGRIEARKELKETELQAQAQEVKVNLYQIKKRINQHFFAILQLHEQRALLESKEDALAGRVTEIQSQVKYGAALPASENVLKAEILKLEQQQDELASQLEFVLNSLSAYIEKPLDSSTVFVAPGQKIILENEGSRPELKLFSLKQKELEQHQKLLARSLLPGIYGFGQAGYGRPGYNMLDTSFQEFYMVGLKLNWNVFDWGKTREQINSLEISKDLIEAEKETFNFNKSLELQEAEARIEKFQKMLLKDLEIISLREGIAETAGSHLRNGIITPSEYLTEFNNLYEAKINQQLHLIELQRAKADYKVIKGNPEN